MSGKSHWKDLDAVLFRSLVSALDTLTGRHPFFGGRFKDIGYAVCSGPGPASSITGTSTGAVTS